MKPAQSDSRREIYDLVQGMEDVLRNARWMANALAQLSQSIEDGHGESVWIMADMISGNIAALEETQTKLFHLTHDAAFGPLPPSIEKIRRNALRKAAKEDA